VQTVAARSASALWLSTQHHAEAAAGGQPACAPLSLLPLAGEGLPFIHVPSTSTLFPCAPSRVCGAQDVTPAEVAMQLAVQDVRAFRGDLAAFNWGVSVGEAAEVEELQVWDPS